MFSPELAHAVAESPIATCDSDAVPSCAVSLQGFPFFTFLQWVLVLHGRTQWADRRGKTHPMPIEGSSPDTEGWARKQTKQCLMLVFRCRNKDDVLVGFMLAAQCNTQSTGILLCTLQKLLHPSVPHFTSIQQLCPTAQRQWEDKQDQKKWSFILHSFITEIGDDRKIHIHIFGTYKARM